MASLFKSDFFRGNRERLRNTLDKPTLIVATANGLLQRSSDTTFPFHQDGGFWYLTGIDEPDIVLVMEGQNEYLIVPKRESVREAFDGAVDFAEAKRQSGVTEVLAGDAGWERLGKRLGAVKQVATLLPNPPYLDYFGIYTNPARQLLVEELKTYNPQLEFIDLRLPLARLRMVKQPQELAALQQAIDITIDAIAEAANLKALKKYKYEYELEAELSRGFRRRGARGHAFDPIVAGGKQATTIHNISNNARLYQGELVVIDVGAEYDHYAADITRTVSNGKATARQQSVYRAVLKVQEYALSLLKPGVLMKEYEKQVEAYMGEQLVSLGLIKTADHESIRHYYPHACSHFLGLDAHDAGDYEQPLVPGVVLTVEPGIYIPEEGIGVRIEDDVLITKKGVDVLSARLPRELTLDYNSANE